MHCRRALCAVFVTILCSLCYGAGARAATRPTVAGELKRLLAAGTRRDEALPLAAERAGGLAWEYLFPFDGQRPPWISSLAQGTGLQAMAREAIRLGRQADVLPLAGRGLGIFQTPPPAGVRVET